jgi:phospholipase D1/2
MAGKPFQVGRFAHSMRVHLMREHLGVDVDEILEQDLMTTEPVKSEEEIQQWDPEHEQGRSDGKLTEIKPKRNPQPGAIGNLAENAQDTAWQGLHALQDVTTIDFAAGAKRIRLRPNQLDANMGPDELDEERRMMGRDGQKREGFPDALVPTVEEQVVMESLPAQTAGNDKPIMESLKSSGAGQAADFQSGAPEEARVKDGSGEKYGAPALASTDPQMDNQPPHLPDETVDADSTEKAAVSARKTLRKHLDARVGHKPWTVPTPKPVVDPNRFEDPVCDSFYKDVWMVAAAHNTEIYRKVFHCVPDDLVTTWKQYKEFVAHQERLSKPAKDAPANQTTAPVARVFGEAQDSSHQGEKSEASHITAESQVNDSTDHEGAQNSGNEKVKKGEPSHLQSPSNSSIPLSASTTLQVNSSQKSKQRKATHIDEPLDNWEREEMEKLLNEVVGHLVIFPTRFLEGEDISNNFLFNADRMLPMPIYN